MRDTTGCEDRMIKGYHFAEDKQIIQASDFLFVQPVNRHMITEDTIVHTEAKSMEKEGMEIEKC